MRPISPETSWIWKKAYVLGSKLLILGMVIPPLIGNPFTGYKTPTIGLMTIPYYMELMEFRPQHVYSHMDDAWVLCGESDLETMIN